MADGYEVVHYDRVDPVDCPCGWSRRAFTDPGSPASMHVVRIRAEAHVHYHKRLSETYYVLEGQGMLEVDDDRVPLAPGMAVRINPGCRHRAVGDLLMLIVSTPPFDPDDEYLD